jgi:DNA replication and repair protein RecF
LKSNLSRTAILDQLPVWNEQIIETGCRIIKNRYEIAEKLQNQCSEMFNQVFGCQENIDIKYLSLGRKTMEDAFDYLPKTLEKNRDNEIERRAVLVGPHRDDLLINLNEHSARLYASQGQQRSLVLCLKLAEMEIIFKEKDEYPILMLDDVLSELDESRREFLMNYIRSSNKQTLITATDLGQSDKQKNYSVYKVNQGTIRRES